MWQAALASARCGGDLMRLSTQQQACVGELIRSLLQLNDGGPPVWERWIPQFREALGLDVVLLHDLEEGENRFQLGRGFSAGSVIGESAFLTGMDEMIRTSDRRWGIYDPLRPEPVQQNRALLFPSTRPFRAQLEERRALATRYGVTDEQTAALAVTGFDHATRFFERARIQDHFQMRALVCERGALLGWLGGFKRECPTEADRLMLQSLVPVVQRRLSLERRLFGTPLWQAALVAALEALERPAFLVDRSGRVQHCNREGQERLDRNRQLTHQQLLESISNPGGKHEVIPVRASGAPPHFLVILHGPRRAAEDRVAEAVRRWRLTPAETRVLSLLAAGKSNKEIAQELTCSPKTVEVHVTRLLAKSGATSRNELSARFWNGL